MVFTGQIVTADQELVAAAVCVCHGCSCLLGYMLASLMYCCVLLFRNIKYSLTVLVFVGFRGTSRVCVILILVCLNISEVKALCTFCNLRVNAHLWICDCCVKFFILLCKYL